MCIRDRGFTGRYLANYNDTAVAPELDQATFLYRLLSGDVSDAKSRVRASRRRSSGSKSKSKSKTRGVPGTAGSTL